jgi:rhomboid family GlyGly-CTERM serine protease
VHADASGVQKVWQVTLKSQPPLVEPEARQSKWLLCLGVSLCALAMTYWPDGLVHFRYDRAGLSSGQAWRVLTAHFVHLNTPHLLFNLLGLFLLCELLWYRMSNIHALGLFGAAAVGVSGLLYWLHPELAWYAGLSGALHGIWAGCALAGWSLLTIHSDALSARASSGWKMLPARWPVSRCVCAIGMVLLVAKLALEFRYGPSVRTEQTIGGPVVTVVHLYGALMGICYVLIWLGIRILQREK